MKSCMFPYVFGEYTTIPSRFLEVRQVASGVQVFFLKNVTVFVFFSIDKGQFLGYMYTYHNMRNLKETGEDNVQRTHPAPKSSNGV